MRAKFIPDGYPHGPSGSRTCEPRIVLRYRLSVYTDAWRLQVVLGHTLGMSSKSADSVSSRLEAYGSWLNGKAEDAEVSPQIGQLTMTSFDEIANFPLPPGPLNSAPASTNRVTCSVFKQLSHDYTPFPIHAACCRSIPVLVVPDHTDGDVTASAVCAWRRVSASHGLCTFWPFVLMYSTSEHLTLISPGFCAKLQPFVGGALTGRGGPHT